MVRNKRGWIKVIEASISILMIASVVLVVLAQNPKLQDEFNTKAIEEENNMLLEIQNNQTLRNEILSHAQDTLTFDQDENSNILSKWLFYSTPEYLECSLLSCDPTVSCNKVSKDSKDLYVKQIVITSNKQTMNPRIVGLFCSKNEN